MIGEVLLGVCFGSVGTLVAVGFGAAARLGSRGHGLTARELCQRKLDVWNAEIARLECEIDLALNERDDDRLACALICETDIVRRHVADLAELARVL